MPIGFANDRLGLHEEGRRRVESFEALLTARAGHAFAQGQAW